VIDKGFVKFTFVTPFVQLYRVVGHTANFMVARWYQIIRALKFAWSIKKMLVRQILTLLLLYGVYTETGIWTSLFLALIWASIEIEAVRRKRRWEEIDLNVDLTRIL